MALLEVWSPFRELEKFRKEYDDVLQRLLGGPEQGRREFLPAVPPVDSFVEGGRLTMRFDLPGIDPDDVEVNVIGNELTVRGSRQETSEKKGHNFIRREIRYGSFERTVELPAGVRPDDIKASYKDGVLELTALVPKEMAPRTIKIAAAGSKDKKMAAKESKPA